MQFLIENMHCDGCVRSVTRTIRTLDPEAEVSADLASHEVDVETSAPRADLEAALSAAGYPPAKAA